MLTTKSNATDAKMEEMIVEKIMELFKNEQFILSIAKSITKIIKQEVASDIDKINKKISELVEKNKLLMCNMDNCEQYSRKNNLRIFGLPYENNENLEDKVIKMLDDKMSIKTTHKEIKFVYRIKPKQANKSSNKNHPVIIRMDSRLRKLVFTNKKSLKGSGITIREDLTKQRLQIYKDAVNKFTFKNVWTNQGKIFVKCADKIHTIITLDQLHKIITKC